MKIFLSIVLLITSLFGFSQSSTRGALVTVDTSNFSNSAGFIRPTIKMLAVNRLDNAVVYWDLSSWSTVSTSGSGGSGWALTGNSGTTAGANFIGTTDAQDLVIKTNDDEIAKFNGDGTYGIRFGIGGLASGYNSISFGAGLATGSSSFAASVSSAFGDVSTGLSAGTAYGNLSTAIGTGTKSKSFGGVVLGLYNDSTNATSGTVYSTSNRAFQVGIGTSDAIRANAMTVLFNGNTGIGTTTPTSKLQVVGLPVYANNAAAIAGGLTVGAFYRTGADPDPVCVVH